MMTSEDLGIVCEWFFSDKPIEKFPKSEQRFLRLAQQLVTTHGVGGKFAESLIHHKYSITPPEGIHGWDGYHGKTPVEIKVETISKTKMSAMASFADNRKSATIKTGEIFLKERPIFINVGVSPEGKCLYVMFTYTDKLPKTAVLFERLNDPAPRISWGHYSEHKSKATVVMYMDKPLCATYKDKFAKFFYEDLNGMY
jgi:hypothetical protein